MTADETRKRAALIVRDARTRRSNASSLGAWPLPPSAAVEEYDDGGRTTAVVVAPE